MCLSTLPGVQVHVRAGMSDIDSKLESIGAESRFTGFQNLMQNRVNEILLVSNLYDSFILAQDGQLHELILSEFMDMNLFNTPGITRVHDAKEGLSLLRKKPKFDLVITTMRVGEMPVTEFARKIRKLGQNIPVVLLAYDNRELENLQELNDDNSIERLFLWHGDFRILLAITKYIEDRLNVEHDTRAMGVQTILLIEDNIHFYSSYLPLIYTEVMRHSQNLISEGMNLAHKMMRMRARPKILLCDTFEEAWEFYKRYEKNVLGVISDIEFPRKGKKDPRAGTEFAKLVKARRPDIPILLQSFQPRNAKLAEELEIGFLQKNSPTLLHDLRSYMLKNFGFGDFVFVLPDGREIDRAADLKSLEEKLKTVPDESILYHAERDHFSRWLKARTEFGIAARLYPRKVKDYPTVDALRQDLVESIEEFRHERSRVLVSDFRGDTFDPSGSFARIGDGSMGGKARGLAFLSHLISLYQLRNRFQNVLISVPPLAVVCTDVFDQFLENNDLRDFAIQSQSDRKIRERFLQSRFPREIRYELAEYLTLMDTPLAVRSSSLLEDSQYQPFAGVYETYMLPNNDEDLEARLDDLIRAIKLIYASTFARRAKSYIKATPYRVEEEKMAVIVQKLAGAKHDRLFYPEVSGIARSHNFYPASPMKTEDGLVFGALGLGRTVVDGDNTLRFCPKFPRHLQQFTNMEDFLEYTQKSFWALDMPDPGTPPDPDAELGLVRRGIEVAESDGTLVYLGSVYSPDNDVVYDGLSRPGVRLITFAPILKHKLFPLPEILQILIDLGVRGMGMAVEIEFAATLSLPQGSPKEFVVLQIRPMVISKELENIKLDEIRQEDMICRSSLVMGMGELSTISDVVTVDRENFDRAKTREIAGEIARFNAKLVAEGRSYILIGMGRWGSADPWLGIPVTWDQISGARVIIETGFKDLKITPSQGAHFFHNLVSMMVGYFTINEQNGENKIDWEWLAEQKSFQKGNFVRHLRFKDPLIVRMNGHKNQGVILKPGVRTGINNSVDYPENTL